MPYAFPLYNRGPEGRRKLFSTRQEFEGLLLSEETYPKGARFAAKARIIRDNVHGFREVPINLKCYRSSEPS